jgi:putative membrane protein (TIGR04086 family)
MMKTVSEKQSLSVRQLVMPGLIGILGAFIASVLLLIVFAIVMSVKDMPSSIILPFACISVSVGAFCGGFVASRLYRSHGLIVGAVTGLVFYLILYLIGIMMRQAGLNTSMLLKLILSTVFGALGGVTGVNFRRRRSKI